MGVKVFALAVSQYGSLSLLASALEAQVQTWMDSHPGITVVALTQGVAVSDYLLSTLLYTEAQEANHATG